MKTVIEYYTREAGVRNLEREVGSICRKVARLLVQEKSANTDEQFRYIVDAVTVKKLLGPTKFRAQRAMERSEVGLANGLAVTEIGGDVMQIEATLVEGLAKSPDRQTRRRDAGISASGGHLRAFARC